MAKHNAAAVKRASNDAYAENHPRRDRIARKQTRRHAVMKREERWLDEMGIEVDRTKPPFGTKPVAVKRRRR